MASVRVTMRDGSVFEVGELSLWAQGQAQRWALKQGLGTDPAVGLVFNIKKFRGIKPRPGLIGLKVSPQGFRQGFAHHTSTIPNRFQGISAFGRVF